MARVCWITQNMATLPIELPTAPRSARVVPHSTSAHFASHSPPHGTCPPASAVLDSRLFRRGGAGAGCVACREEAGGKLNPKAISLQTAVRFVRQGAFDGVRVESWLQIVFPKGRPMGKTQLFHERQSGQRAFCQKLEQRFDLVAHLVAHLVGGRCLLQCREQG